MLNLSLTLVCSSPRCTHPIAVAVRPVLQAEVEAGELAHGKIVFYSTTVTGVLQTKIDCSQMRKIFQRLRVPFEERNVYMSTIFAAELKDRLPGQTVPQAFFNGQLIGVRTPPRLPHLTQLFREATLTAHACAFVVV